MLWRAAILFVYVGRCWLSGDPEVSFMDNKHAGYPNSCYLSDDSFASNSNLVSTSVYYKSRHLFG